MMRDPIEIRCFAREIKSAWNSKSVTRFRRETCVGREKLGRRPPVVCEQMSVVIPVLLSAEIHLFPRSNDLQCAGSTYFTQNYMDDKLLIHKLEITTKSFPSVRELFDP